MNPLAALALLMGFLLLLAGRFRLRRRRHGELPILMYHKVELDPGDPWTVTIADLDRQWSYLKSAGYQPITCGELVRHLKGQFRLPNKPILITFDDAYQNNLLHAYPLLRRHGLRATIFLPVKFIGGENEWDGGGQPLLTYAQLRQMSPDVVEFGLHSYEHGNYRRMTFDQIEADLEQCLTALGSSGLPYEPVLAYAYGGYPRGPIAGRRFRAMLAQLGIECGLRVGNKVNRLPIANRYGLRRIDIRREDTLETFREKLDGR